MRGAAVPTQVNRGEAIVLVEVFIVGSADDVIDEHGSHAALWLAERLPEDGVTDGLAATQRPAGVVEVLERRDEVVLTARRAGERAQMRIATLARRLHLIPVSYTHLTLPPIYSV